MHSNETYGLNLNLTMEIYSLLGFFSLPLILFSCAQCVMMIVLLIMAKRNKKYLKDVQSQMQNFNLILRKEESRNNDMNGANKQLKRNEYKEGNEASLIAEEIEMHSNETYGLNL